MRSDRRAAEWAAPGAVDERLPAQVRTQVEVRAKYAGYIERQQAEIERARRHEELAAAGGPGLRPHDADCPTRCARSSARRGRPPSAQAGRLPGVTPAAVQILLVHLKRHAARAQVA